MNDEDFMRIALNEAELALAEGNLPVGMVVVLDGEVIVRAHKTSDPLGHAEVLGVNEAVALKPSQKDRKRMKVVCTLEPCGMCLFTTRHALFSEIVYAFEDPFSGALGIPHEHLPQMHQDNPFTVRRGVLRAESKLLFRRYFSTTSQTFWQKNPSNPLIVAAFAED